LDRLRTARDRTGVIPRNRQRERAVDRAIAQLFLSGVSTEKMKLVTRRLLGWGFSAGTLWRMNRKLTREMRAWMDAPLTNDVIYLIVDGLDLPIRRRQPSKKSLLVAVGIMAAGNRRLLDVSIGNRESSASWKPFFEELKQRGLLGEALKIGIMGGLPGLEAAFREAFPRAEIQRCIVQKLPNIAARLPQKFQNESLVNVRNVFSASSRKGTLLSLAL